MPDRDRRFGVLLNQDAPLSELRERWRRIEEMGFDQIFVADHSGDYRNLGGTWFDGWTVLAAMATDTGQVRIGTLVTNPILRGPALLAKEAVTVDHLSGGRLELGIGTGIAPFDHAAVGSDPWPPKERLGRFVEYVEIVDGLLRGAGRPYSFEGRWYRAEGAPTAPAPVQQPRPPIMVAGQSPTALRVAAERADAWNTHGPFGATLDEIVGLTRRQNASLDERCAAAGRDPGDVRRSALLFGPLDPWTSKVEATEIVERFAGAGISEFVVSWPSARHRGAFERFAADLL